MAVIRLGGFRGELPRIHPRLLPEGGAQTATNCRMDSGALESVRGTSVLQAIDGGVTDPISLHRYSSTIWLEADSDVDWVPYPVINDAYGRLIYADPSTPNIRVTDASLVGTGGSPANYYNLAVPPPSQGFSATLVGTADFEDETPETRYYVCTYVNSWGAEGPPSPTSNQVEWRTGQTVTLSGLPAVPSGPYNIAHRRIYRINTGSTGVTNFQFVAEIAVIASTANVTAITQASPIVVTTATPHGLLEGQQVKFTGLGTDTPATNPITNISKASPARVTLTAHGFSSGDWVELSDLGGVYGMDELNDVRASITLVNADQFELYSEPGTPIDSTGYTDYQSGGVAAVTHGMDELVGNFYTVSITDTTTITLLGVDGTAYKKYLDSGTVGQPSGTTYTDAVPSANLAEVIPTELYDPPNANTIGIKAHPAGFLVGFFGNTLTFSETGAPHAWPVDYRLVTSHDIVGLGVYGNTVAVLTKGWPYLAIGSDPSAMSMIELEIEQACVAKRGIVDFGSAIAYPSPDGLIVLSGRGATNASSGMFTRDQWQALDPTTFVAFNWEQKYLCFYGANQAFVIDPFDPDAGVRYINKLAVGGYKDIEEDVLYLIEGTDIVQWDQGTSLTYTWKSRPNYTPRPVNMSCAKIIADAYPVSIEFYVDDVRRYDRVVQSIDAFKLPGGFRGEKFEVILKGTKKVSEVTMATTMRELAAIV